MYVLYREGRGGKKDKDMRRLFFGVSVSPLVTPCDLALGVPLKQWHLSNHACVNLSVFLFYSLFPYLSLPFLPFLLPAAGFYNE